MRKSPAVLRRRLLRASASLYRAFAWRSERDPFWGLVAEVLLAKTPAERVEPVWLALRRRAATPRGLLQMGSRPLVRMLHPLGLQQRRAAQIRRLAELWVAHPDPTAGAVSEGAATGIGVGPYARAAFSTFFLGAPRLSVDGNVRRVLSRYMGKTGFDHEAERFGERAMPRGSAEGRRFGYALLDLAGTVCSARAPRCPQCPLMGTCESAEAGPAS